MLKWCDYSSKYGLAYLLSDGRFGVSFNDGSRFLAKAQDKNFVYQSKVKYNDGKIRNITRKHEFAAFPEDLTQKVRLWAKFKDYLQSDSVKNNSKLAAPEETPSEQDVLVKSWERRSDKTIFYLSSGLIQANFKDGSEVYIDTALDTIALVSSKMELNLFDLQKLPENDNAQGLLQKVHSICEVRSNSRLAASAFVDQGSRVSYDTGLKKKKTLLRSCNTSAPMSSSLMTQLSTFNKL